MTAASPRGAKALSLAILLLAGTSLGAPARAQGADPRVTEVDLGQSGLARYLMTATVSGDSFTFEVPRDHADDVLASLVVSDPNGGVYGIHTDTPSTTAEALRGTPFADGLPGDIDALIGALRGESVTIKTPVGETTGRVIAVSTRQEVEDRTLITRSVALLQTETGIVEVVLRPGVSVAFEPGADALADAASQGAATDGRRRFEVTLREGAERRVDLSYITEAPVWKNSWRLLLDEGRLQGWATLENVSGQDWQGVTLTLSTGAPVAYQRDLLEPQRIDRLTPPDLLGTRPDVAADPGLVGAKRNRAAAGAMQGRSATGMMRMAPFAEAAPVMDAAPAPSGAAEAAEELRGIGNVRYRIPWSVDLPAGRTADLLYIDVAVDPEIRALYQPARSREVLLAASLSADQPLAPGLVSIRDANGFVGDAPFTGLAAGETRLLPYAAAPGATVTEDRRTTGNEIDLSFADGLLRAETALTTRTLYEAALPGDIDVFAVEHPRGPGELVRTNGAVERNAGTYRVSVPVGEAGEVRVQIVERKLQSETIAIERNQIDSFFAAIRRGGGQLDAEDQAVLSEASDVLARIAAAERRRDDLAARYETLTREQERLRSNLESVEQSALRDRYLTALDRTETEIGETLDGLEDARGQITDGEDRLAETVRRFG